MGAIINLMDLAQGRMRLIEVTLAENAPAVVHHQTLDELHLPDSVRVVAGRSELAAVGSLAVDALPRTRSRDLDHARRRDAGVRVGVRRLSDGPHKSDET